MNTLTTAINVLTQVQALAASLNITVEALMANMEKMVKCHNDGLVWCALSKEEYEARNTTTKQETPVEEVELTKEQQAYKVVNGKVVSAEEAEVWFKEFMAVEEVEEEVIAMNAKATFISLVQNKKEVEDEEEVITDVVNAIQGDKEEELQEVIDYIIGSDLLGKQQLIHEIRKHMEEVEVEEVKADYDEYMDRMNKEEYERKLAKLMEVEEVEEVELEVNEDWLFNGGEVTATKTDEVPWLILD